LEKDAFSSVIVEAPTVVAFSAAAGEDVQALALLLPKRIVVSTQNSITKR
jgi:hypothetical protein